MKIMIQKIHKDAKIPEFAHKGDAGTDLYSVDETKISPNEIKLVSTGIKIAIPEGYEIQVRPKSGLALNHGITLLNTPGTIDSGYRGEVKVIMANFGKETFKIEKGSKIAQLILNKIEFPEFELTEELPDSSRKEGGFGSTGLR